MSKNTAAVKTKRTARPKTAYRATGMEEHSPRAIESLENDKALPKWFRYLNTLPNNGTNADAAKQLAERFKLHPHDADTVVVLHMFS